MASMSNKYSADNAASRGKLEALVGRLTDRDITRAAQHGWTVGGVLAHLAFYDYRAVVLLERWKTNAIAPSPNDVDTINDSLKPIANAVAPAEIRRVVVEAARAADAAIDALDPGFLARVESEGTAVRLNRAQHRSHHLEQVEKAMAGGQ